MLSVFDIAGSSKVIGTPFDLPIFDEKDIIEFYYLESSLPFNTPIEIMLVLQKFKQY